MKMINENNVKINLKFMSEMRNIKNENKSKLCF